MSGEKGFTSNRDGAADIVEPVVPDSASANNGPSKKHMSVIEGARAAAEKERNMTLMQGLRLYPKAVAWSVLISTCIVMEGYDVCLINNFCKSVIMLILLHRQITNEKTRCYASVCS